MAAGGEPLAGDLRVFADPGEGLDAAVSEALGRLAADGAARAVVVAGDLPLVTPGDLGRLAAASERAIVLAPDRHGTGTNAISLPLPAARNFGFGYGPGSFARHCAEAARLGLAVETVVSDGLARDVDEPADLADAAGLIAAIS